MIWLQDREITLSATVHLASLRPEEVTVEVYYGSICDDKITEAKTKEMKLVRQVDSSAYCYECKLQLTDGGEYGYTFRVIPRHPNLMGKFDLPLVKWANC